MTPGTARLTLHGPVLTDGRQLGPTRVVVADGKIAEVQPGATADGAEIVVSDGWIAPGFVDLQANGAGGVDLTSADDPEAAVVEVARVLARHGVTAFCPTVVSSRPEVILGRLKAYRPRVVAADGAESLGLHQEGPFIAPNHRGVHDPAVLRPPDPAEIERWLELQPPAIVTLAPELPGALDAIRRLVAAGTVVSLGHSGADAAAARAGLKAGARMGTHLFNAMPPLHHRRPGLVGALLASPAFVGVIADGVHLDPLTVELVVRAAGPGRVVLVSDALAAAGTPAGPSALGDQIVMSDGRSVRRADGTLAGSTLLLDGCVANVHRWVPWLTPAEVVRMASETPARVIGPDVARRKGRVALGYDADLAILDADWRVVKTVVRGIVVERDVPELRALAERPGMSATDDR